MVEETIFSTSTEGICGKIKQRYADFIVEEIGLDGKVCEVKRFLQEDALNKATLVVVPQNDVPREKQQLICELEKFNTDLNFAVSRMSRFFQLSKKRFGYAGLKDKRAISCQRISIFEPDAEKLKLFQSRMLDLRPLEWSSERIEIGALKGNRFTITIRGVELEEGELKKRILSFFAEAKEKGIANYFGEQRFGGIREITHLVGREFAKGKLEEAVMLYLTKFSEKEEEDIKKARENLAKTMDFAAASKEFPVKYRYERAIIHHLCKEPKDFVGAFRKLPKAMRYLFTHAYQSHLFNRVIEERLKAGIGLKAIKGDILIDGVPTAPLFGFESKLADGKAGEIEKKVLEEEGIALKDFQIKSFAELSSKGSRKKIVLVVHEPELLEIAADELNEGRLKARIRFWLDKGNYATTVLAELMKNSSG